MTSTGERVHELVPTPATLHGTFSAEREPALTILPGEAVRYRTLDIGWGLGPPDSAGERDRHESRVPGIPLVGPVAIVGAEPGMTLEVEILEVRPGTWGYTLAGSGLAPFDRHLDLGEDDAEELMRWRLDPEAFVGVSEDGATVTLSPFLGTIGMPGREEGEQSAWPPRRTGGNMDCKELVAGAKLYLPIEVTNGLVSVGDGHARQGDGEVAGMAIECPFDRVEVRYRLREDIALTGPRIWTEEAWMTLGFGEDLDTAAVSALAAMLDLMMGEYNVSRKRALALASAVVDLRITQRANPLAGVHAVLAHGAIT